MSILFDIIDLVSVALSTSLLQLYPICIVVVISETYTVLEGT